MNNLIISEYLKLDLQFGKRGIPWPHMAPLSASWSPRIDELLQDHVKVIVSVDGSDQAHVSRTCRSNVREPLIQRLMIKYYKDIK